MPGKDSVLLPSIGIWYVAETYTRSLTDNQCVQKKIRGGGGVHILYGKTYWDSHVEICEEYSQTEMSRNELMEQTGKISNKLPIESEIHQYLWRNSNCMSDVSLS